MTNILEEQASKTGRIVVPAIEKILNTKIDILDHGFVRVVDYMGGDNAIVQAARVSYGSGTKKVNQDRGLINYLMKHKHTTPFEMCEIKFHVKMPIFVARQWIRHRTANVNEYSARYSIMNKEFYIPDASNICEQSATNKQGREVAVSPEEAKNIQDILLRDASNCYDTYEYLLNSDSEGNKSVSERGQIARELARMNLPLNYYTEMYWKIDLHNLLHFLHLRADPHAQYEIRVYAEAMLDIVKAWVPFTYDAFIDYKVGAFELSAKAKKVVQRLLCGEKVTAENSGMSKREWAELQQHLEFDNS